MLKYFKVSLKSLAILKEFKLRNYTEAEVFGLKEINVTPCIKNNLSYD